MSKERLEQLLRARAEREGRSPEAVIAEFTELAADLKPSLATMRYWRDRADLLGQVYAHRKDPEHVPMPDVEEMTPRELRDNYWAAKGARGQANKSIYCLDNKLNTYLGEDLFKNGGLIQGGADDAE